MLEYYLDLVDDSDEIQSEDIWFCGESHEIEKIDCTTSLHIKTFTAKRLKIDDHKLELSAKEKEIEQFFRTNNFYPPSPLYTTLEVLGNIFSEIRVVGFDGYDSSDPLAKEAKLCFSQTAINITALYKNGYDLPTLIE